MSYAFDKNAKDGDTVTLENGVTYQYEEAKDRWMVLSVDGDDDGEIGRHYPRIWTLSQTPDPGHVTTHALAGGDGTSKPGLVDKLKFYDYPVDPNGTTPFDERMPLAKPGEAYSFYREVDGEPTREHSFFVVYAERKDGYVEATINPAKYSGTAEDFIYETNYAIRLESPNYVIDNGQFVSKTGGDEMEGPLDIRRQDDGGDSRDTNKVKTLGVYSGSENSALRLGIGEGSDKVYIGKNDTSFNGPIKVNEIVERHDGDGTTVTDTLNLNDTLNFGSAHSTLMTINPEVGETQQIDLFGNGQDKILNVNIQGATYKNAIEFESGASASREPILRIDSNKGLKAKYLSAWETRIRDVAAPENEDDATNKAYVDAADQHLQTKIDELEQELDVVAPRLESGAYTYSDSPAVKAGEMHVASGTFTAGTDVVLFNDVALDGKTHTWAELNEGDYLEITDTQEKTRTAQNYAMYLVTKAPEGTGLKQIEVALVKGQGAPTAGDVMDAKSFQLGGNDINDLDERYAGKEAERLNISHQAENTAWYNAPHKLGIVPANIQTEIWGGTSSYERIKQAGQEGLLAFTTKSPTSAGTIAFLSWSQISEGQILYLRNADSRLDNTALKKMAAEDIGSVIVMRQPSTGAELSLHVRSTNTKTSNGVDEHSSYVQIRRKRGAPTEDGEWRVYLQKEYLSAKGHDHYVGRLNTREERMLKKWKSLSSNEFSLSEATGNPSDGDGCYSWSRGRWFKVYSQQFNGSIISGDYNNGLGIATIQKGNTIYCGYLTVSNCYNYNGDHTWRTQSFMGNYENAPISEWEENFTVSTNGLIQNTRTPYKDSAYTNVYSLGSPDEDIENPERPIWTGDNFGDFKNLDDFVAELKSADPDGSSIEFLMEQWQTYWYTPGR